MRYNRIFLLLMGLCVLFFACQRTQAHDTPQDQKFTDHTYFLGDSLTAHMVQRSELSPTQIFATKERYLNLDSHILSTRIIAPDTGKEELISDAVGRIRPQFLIITLGIDYGVYYYRDNLSIFAKYYEKLLDAIQKASPDTQIILQSIFPVTKDCQVLTNKMIDNANATVREIASRRQLPYLDTQSILRDENGFLNAKYCISTDGIHLNSEAYHRIVAYINAQAEERGWNT